MVQTCVAIFVVGLKVSYLLFTIARKTWFSVVNGVFLLVCVKLDSSSALNLFIFGVRSQFGRRASLAGM